MIRMRSWLYCPGNSPGKILNAGIYGADAVVLDLEDSVPSSEKDEARILVAEALENTDFGVPCAVRINGLETAWWQDDLIAVLSKGAAIIRVPKVESRDDAARVVGETAKLESRFGKPVGSTTLHFILETPSGVENAFDIANCSTGSHTASGAGFRPGALCFGAEDYCTATGMSRPGPEYTLDYPRSRIAAAAASAGLICFDTVWAAYGDNEGLVEDSRRARSLGFSGKSVIHPDQIDAVNEIFSPSGEERAWAEKVVSLTESQGGATGMDRSMVDRPVMLRALRILGLQENTNA